jgi:hypothetical protein
MEVVISVRHYRLEEFSRRSGPHFKAGTETSFAQPVAHDNACENANNAENPEATQTAHNGTENMNRSRVQAST